jgi:hypothetical protein
MNQYVYDATQQKWFVNQWERRMSELEKMRLAGKFGKKNEYSDWECKAMFEELERAGSTRKEAISTQSKYRGR